LIFYSAGFHDSIGKIGLDMTGSLAWVIHAHHLLVLFYAEEEAAWNIKPSSECGTQQIQRFVLSAGSVASEASNNIQSTWDLFF
jgi:hypothetical protein